ncbi:MAG: TldD/PmbA family protein, partial [Clostridia bacterium]|nr:TldD/PmbA family protein [Clostridia bacterium]
MIQQPLLQELLGIAVSTGADFAEIFAEQERTYSLRLVSGKIESVGDLLLCGVGIRAFCGTKTYYASTSDTSREGLLRCAAAVAGAIGDPDTAYAGAFIGTLADREVKRDAIRRLPGDVAASEKSDLLREACDAAKNESEKISQVQGTYSDVDREFLVANTEGLLASDRKVRTRIAVNATASEGGENQSGFYGPCAGMGIEFFEKVSPREVGKIAARQALTNLGAVYCPAGTMTVAIENGFGGVIFHEACGHSLEATSVAIGASQMAGKLGQQIANPKV